MVRSSTIGRIKNRIAKYRTQTCQIERETDARGTANEITHALEIVEPEVSCRLITLGQQSRTSQTRDVGSQETQIDTFRLDCPVGTDFAVDDVVTLDDGRVFHVTSVLEDLSDAVFASAILIRQRGSDG